MSESALTQHYEPVRISKRCLRSPIPKPRVPTTRLQPFHVPRPLCDRALCSFASQPLPQRVRRNYRRFSRSRRKKQENDGAAAAHRS
jgi:hypothetical protein